MHDVADLEIVEEVAAKPLDVLTRHHMRRVLVLGHTLDAEAQLLILDRQHHRRIPGALERDVAGDTHIGQRLAPIVDLGGIDALAGAAPGAQPAIILLELPLQRVSGNHLHLGVDGGAHGQTAGKELALAEILGELAADLVGEIIARRQSGLEALEIAVLHRVAPLQQPLLAAHRVEIRRRLGQRGEEGGLMRGELAQGLVEIGLGGGGDAIGVLAEEDLVHVQFENALLVERFLEPGGKDDLFDLALDPAVAGEQEVLHHLLGDGRGAAHVLAARLHRLDTGGDDAARVIAGVVVEILVLGRDEGLFDQVGDLFGGGEKPAFLGELIDHPAFTGIDPADCRRLVLGQRFVAGQIAAIDPEDRADRQCDGRGPHGDHGENATKERKDEPQHHALLLV